MIEMDDTLSRRLVGKEALVKKLETILKTIKGDIPYYQAGLEAELFSYTSPQEAITRALAKFNPSVTIKEGNTRVVVADVDIDVTNYIGDLS